MGVNTKHPFASTVTVPPLGCVKPSITVASPSGSAISLFIAQMVTGVLIGVVVKSLTATGPVSVPQFSLTVTFTKMVSQAPVSSHPVTSITSSCKKPGSGVYCTQLFSRMVKPQSKVVCKVVTAAVVFKVQKFTQNWIGTTGAVHKLSGFSHGSAVSGITVMVTVAVSQLPSSSHTVYSKSVVPV